MKNSYMSVPNKLGRPWFWVFLLLGLWLPLATQAQTVTISPSTAQSFGNVPVGQTSQSKSFAISGSNLNRDITVIVPAGFEGSLDNSNFSTGSLIVSRTGSSASGTVYVRFAPTAQTAYDDDLQVTSRNATSVIVTLTGVGTVGTPTITVNPTALGFGNQLVNTASASQAITVKATSLTDGIVATAPQGFEISTNSTSGFASSVNLAQTGGAVNTTVYVRFLPTVVQNYISGVTFTSEGAATQTVNVSGTGQAPAPTLTVNPTSLTSFGSVNVGQASNSQSFTITGRNLTGNVTVVPPTNFQVRLPNGTFSSASITLSGSTIDQIIEVRFQPTNTGNKSGNVQVTSSGITANVAVSGQGNPAPVTPTITANPTSLDFGQVSASGSAQVLTFEVGATNLTTGLVLTASNQNITFRDGSVGGSFTNGPLTINPVGGTVSLRNIEVLLVGPINGSTYNGSISATSAGAQTQAVNITATSIGGTSQIEASGTLQQFSTVPGVPSESQSYLLSGTNLLQSVTVTAPANFQISLDANFTGVTTTGNSIVVARNSGNNINPPVTVYVRFFPSTAITVSSLITNASSPAVAQGLPVSGTSEPSIQLQNSIAQFNNTVIYTTSEPRTISIKADRVRQPITISKNLASNPLNPSNTPQFEVSLDGTNFSNTVTLMPSSSTYSIEQPIYVRYKPTYLGDAQSSLQFQSNDFSNQGVQSFSANDALSGHSIDVEPTLRTAPTVTRNLSTATISFNLPDQYASKGYGEGRIVLASENPTLPAPGQPQDGNSYLTGNQTYGKGPEVSPGYFAVYKGSNPVVTIEGLDIRKTYYFYTFEYNNIFTYLDANNQVQTIAVINSENYLSPPVPSVINGIAAPGLPLPVSLASFTAKLSNKQVALKWVTATEKNNATFVVERSQDARTYTAILSRDGKGTTEKATTYEAVDATPLTGTSYYRLKQVDLDGTATYSSPVAVTNLGTAEVAMYPNPADDVLNIQLVGSTDGVRATITDLAGRVIRTQVLGANGQLNVRDLRSGSYLVTVGEGSAKVTQRIVKK